MSAGQPPRRRNHVDMPVAYAAVGASRAPDLMRFPPSGSTPYEEELRLGSGQERFLLASSLLMTWGAQRGGGFTVRETERGTGATYLSPSFDGAGMPQAAGEVEEHFGPEGEPYVVAGTTAVLGTPGKSDRDILVVYTVSEPRRVGFAWGTRDEDGPVGEQLFAVELRDDDTVWAISRGFLEAPKSGLLGLRARAEVKLAVEAVRKQLAALAPGAQANGVDIDSTATAAPEDTAPELRGTPTAAEPGDAADPTSATAPAAPAEPADLEASGAPAEPADSEASAAPAEPADLEASGAPAEPADPEVSGAPAESAEPADPSVPVDSTPDSSATAGGTASRQDPEQDEEQEQELLREYDSAPAGSSEDGSVATDTAEGSQAPEAPPVPGSVDTANQRVTHKRRPGTPRA
ncbi:uncharacterized protein (UPF0548 family) [Leucobacter luti]|uniref:DUF1990 family protein n=1 Tax=Leucobacter luti TaxID=340320 RepID=UPI00104D7689|nr:DUF1990 family protein [Leucobacter luti]MCW2287959.1 uncharacterized protein (UPF0548 family) [Leucobacter luti]TCK45879.1 uncharacterized protein (UPF0548 family) [Leucobacter luti]